jgi:hypothetical protein|tara:strand:+ start:4412 stop:4966 length:555 start_codon:yes stop_codon:yes gene_type:complete
MSCIKDFITEHYDYLLGVANHHVGEDLGGDLLNDLFTVYLKESPEHVELCRSGELFKYVCKTLSICGFSKTSTFYYKYKKHQEVEVQDYRIERHPIEINEHSSKSKDISKQLTLAFSILDELKWFEASLFKAYYLHNHTLKSLSDATGIKKSTIAKSVKKAERKAKENVERVRGLHRESDTQAC